jgi:nitrite reductase/ring-hydroxylating ferredoxin subunit
MHRGWYQIAFERELRREISPIFLGEQELIVCNFNKTYRAFSAHCPHRGAHLGYGGRIDGDKIICPFHGRRIGCDTPGDDGFCVRSYRTIAVGGLLFALLDEALDNGCSEVLEGLGRTHRFLPGFTIMVPTSPEYVIENALDRRHFQCVHGVDNLPSLELIESETGALLVRTRLETAQANPWQKGSASLGIDLRIRIFSPNLCITEMVIGNTSRHVLTAATPQPNEMCAIRVSLIVPMESTATPSEQAQNSALLRDSRAAIEQDAAIWEHLPKNGRNAFTTDDELVVAYYEFCRKFEAPTGR